jgi:hypothetical protein
MRPSLAPGTATRYIQGRDFDPNQARDEHGRWTDTGAAEGSGSAQSEPAAAGDADARAGQLTGAFSSRSPGASEGDGRDIAQVWELDAPGRAKAETLGVTPQTYHELTSEGAPRFHSAILAAKGALKFGASVHAYEADDYRNMRLFLTEDGKSGFALKGDDIVSAFKHPETKGDKFANALLALAVQNGGRRLDAFDTVLPGIYSENGFRAVARLKWNDEYKPDGWNYETFQKFNGGRPDVVFMVHAGARTPAYARGDGAYVPSYDDGIAAQTDALKPKKKSMTELLWPVAKRNALMRLSTGQRWEIAKAEAQALLRGKCEEGERKR